jgi:hypothetical protein
MVGGTVRAKALDSQRSRGGSGAQHRNARHHCCRVDRVRSCVSGRKGHPVPLADGAAHHYRSASVAIEREPNDLKSRARRPVIALIAGVKSAFGRSSAVAEVRTF